MELIYIFIGLSVAFLEASERFNTRNILKKASMYGLMLGSIAALKNNYEHVLSIAVALYFASQVYCAYSKNRNRRACDRSSSETIA